jgi:hypothetical protein
LFFSGSNIATYFIFEKEAKNSKKVSHSITVTSRPFLATYFIFEKEAKNSKNKLFVQF